MSENDGSMYGWSTILACASIFGLVGLRIFIHELENLEIAIHIFVICRIQTFGFTSTKGVGDTA